MKKIGIGIDYSNICKDYNTAYLDRDNDDRATRKCMNQVLEFTKEFLSNLMENFGCKLYRLNSSEEVKIDEVASKRFLFYSLEKEITLQKYLIQKEYIPYETLATWENEAIESILVENDENGSGIYLYLNEGSEEHQWIIDQLQNFSLEELPFLAK